MSRHLSLSSVVRSDNQYSMTIGAVHKMFEDKTPRDVRHAFRKGELFNVPTAGVCKGYKQANLMVVHKDVADDLEKYCRLNYGPMALVYNSKPGEFGIPSFSTDSNVRTDLSAYNVFIDGEFKETVPDLLSFGDQLNNFCFFYFGCSFSFDDALLSGGVPLRSLEQGHSNVPMFKSNVECHSCGVFRGNMVISMKPIPRDLVERSVQITHPMSDVHGAPVLIGDPTVLGVDDIMQPTSGVACAELDGDIPVFWACGVTGMETVKGAKLPLAFTHKPGCMLITDKVEEGGSISTAPPPEDLPRVVWLADTPPLASVLSQATLDKIQKLEDFAIEDIGKRQIGHLLVPDDLLKSALSLSHATSVAITTGFPIMLEGDNIYETDGPIGAISMATMLQALGKDVVLVVEDVAGLDGLMERLVGLLVERGVLSQSIPVECYPPTGQTASRENATSFLTREDGQSPRFDHLVAIERAGIGQDGRYRSCTGADKSSKVGVVDRLFEVAGEMPRVFTTGIGDGGNEIGMGKVRDRVIAHIPNGDIIATTTTANFLVCTGVSNWGGYALNVALALLRRCPIHDRYRRRSIGLPPTREELQRITTASPSVEKEEKVLKAMMELGFKDPSGEITMSVDWLPFHDVHANKIKEIVNML